MELAPIALFVYNRPEHTRLTVEALGKNGLASESELFIFSDGPENEAAGEKVQKVREYIRTVRGFRKVTITEKENNRGVANSIIAGVSDLCARFGHVIVMEDDLVVSPHFLEYMNSALERYGSHDSVMQISGYMYPIDLHAETDAVFMPFTTSWGWATWQRAWSRFDPLMQGYESLRRDQRLRRRFDLDNAFGCYRMLKAQKEGKIDSWAVRWYLSVFLPGGLILHPAKSLVKNIGFDDSGRHSTSMDTRFTSELSDFRVVIFPSRVEPSWQAYEMCRAFLKTMRHPLFAKIKGLFRGVFQIFI